MDINTILAEKVSLQNSAWDNASSSVSIIEFLGFIKNGKYASQMSFLRGLLNKGELECYEAHKKRLAAVTFSGLFNERRKKERLKKYNEVIVLDIDKLDDEKLQSYKRLLLKDDFVFSLWESPSKRGLKGLIKVYYNFEYSREQIDQIHKSAFAKLVSYFKTNYDIDMDMSGSDYTRLCFVSADPNLFINEKLNEFQINEQDIDEEYKAAETSKEIDVTARGLNKIIDSVKPNISRNRPLHRRQIKSIITFLSKRKLTITHDYEKWYRVAYAIANTFSHDIGEKYYLKLCQLDGKEHNEKESKNMLRYCYENSKGAIHFDTIFYLTKQLGYKRGSTGDD